MSVEDVKMKITRRQLRRIVETFAATAEEEALKVNKEAGISLVTDQAFWDERGISTGEELAKHLLASLTRIITKTCTVYAHAGWLIKSRLCLLKRSRH